MKFLAELYRNAKAAIAKSVDVITQLFTSQNQQPRRDVVIHPSPIIAVPHHPVPSYIQQESDQHVLSSRLNRSIAKSAKHEINVHKQVQKKEKKIVTEKEMCSICLMDIRIHFGLPCRHKFHKKCINEWFDKNTTCPECRRPSLKRDLVRLKRQA